jgi:lipopolysaccharide transport system permease protein
LYSRTISTHLPERKKKRYFIDLILQNAKAGLRAEASRGYLGVLWWVIEPVMYMGIFYIVFAHFLNRGDKGFVLFLLTGLIVWKWFHACIITGSSSLMANAGLMNQVYLPKIVFPLTSIAINTFKFFIILVLFLIFIQFTSVAPSWQWMLLPILILTQLCLIVAVTCLLAAIFPFFPDLRVILDNIMVMFFFLSGIFFNIENLSSSIRSYLLLNPMAALISMYRMLLLEGCPPDWQSVLLVLLFSFSALLLAIMLFRRFDRVYPKIIY